MRRKSEIENFKKSSSSQLIVFHSGWTTHFKMKKKCRAKNTPKNDYFYFEIVM